MGEPSLPAAANAELSGTLTITGSSTIAPLVSAIGQRFEEQHPAVRIDVQTGGSSRGVADARAGLAEIGMVSRALNPVEADLQRYLIARDGVCVIVHESNPVSELTADQIVSIYRGETRNWHDVGGSDGPIAVVNKAEGRSTLELFLEHFHLKNSEIHADVVIGDNEQGIKTIAGNPQAIGYVSVGSVEQNRELGVPIKGLRLDEIDPTTATVAAGMFPIVRELNLVTKGNESLLAREFIRFARSADVRPIVKGLGFVPVE